jgi:hypothetical protein
MVGGVTGEGVEEADERALGAAARVALGLLGPVLVGAGLVAGYFAVAVVAGELGERPVQPLPIYALGLAILAFPLLLVAAGFASLACRRRKGLGPIVLLAAAVAADLLLAIWLARLPADRCAANPPPGRGGAIDATGCIDRSSSPPT